MNQENLRRELGFGDGFAAVIAVALLCAAFALLTPDSKSNCFISCFSGGCVNMMPGSLHAVNEYVLKKIINNTIFAEHKLTKAL